jgi:anti-sigma regulatory factor (Ser/Thr protein kinase)
MDQIRRLLATRTINAVGPALEYALQQPRCNHVLPTLDTLPATEVITALRSAMYAAEESRHLSDTALNPRRAEFAILRSRDGDAERPGWIAYLKRLQAAACQAGFDNGTAAGLAGAVHELVDNVDSHSDAIESGIVGYAYDQGRFEYVVGDSGIGVLASLHKNPQYRRLSDHGQALQTALTDGESRFGRGTGHGLGFRSIFVALAHLNGSLRFRSGDHRLQIDGNGPNLPAALLAQTVLYKGLIVSVVCRTLR